MTTKREATAHAEAVRPLGTAHVQSMARRVLQLAATLEQPLPAPRAPAGGAPTDEMRCLAQARAYARILAERGLLGDERTTFVDLGAGSGLVSAAIRAAMPHAGAQFVLVDQRDKLPTNGARTVRIRADIEALRSPEELLGGLGRPSGAPVIVVANHLCGSALDRSIELFARERGLCGFLAATCCQDKACWDAYCNQAFMGSLGIGERGFRQLCKWSALAPRRNRRPAERKGVCAAARELGIESLDEVQRLGVASRLLIDTGRRLRLEALGLSAHLRCHVSFECTADNVLIVAHRPGSGSQAAAHGRARCD